MKPAVYLSLFNHGYGELFAVLILGLSSAGLYL